MTFFDQSRLPKSLFSFAARSLQGLRRALWKVTGRPAGAHAVPLTSRGRVVLVRLTYAPGWRLPGGGVHKGERPEEAAMRELREEIGLTSHRCIERLTLAGEDPALGALFIARDVEYRPRRSWEVEAVQEFELDALPNATTPRTRRWLQVVAQQR